MPTPTFARLTLEQFAALLATYPFTRRIDAVHMHHTWRPRRSDFRGHATLVAMWRFHTEVKGWSDIAQHVTIDPQGFIWLGRNWNLPPASASGHNGNKFAGPFMFEMIGDFDAGQEPFDGPQRDAALRVIALVQQHFGLPQASLRFHNMMSVKSCPGSSIGYEDTLAQVARIRQELEAPRDVEEAARTWPFPDEADLALQRLVRGLDRVTDNAGEAGDAEPDEAQAEAREGAEQRALPLDAAALAALRPHLINLRAGRFSSEGEFSSTAQDVDAIFEQHLKAQLAALPAGGKLRLLFFAHGGLVSERSGLETARRHVPWWMKNGVYPVYFIWETGLFETLGQLLDRARQGTRAVTRDLADYTTDPLIEVAARVLQGPRVWGGMKWSAQRAAEPASAGSEAGGAWYVAEKLKAFCDAQGDRVELHAAGHSAGSIFHSHFLSVAQDMGVPAFKTLHFLAPALRVDAFKERMLARLRRGGMAGQFTLYTMLRDYERRDDCAHIYRKSLLYLIYHALEDVNRTPILGLEESLRADADLKAFFGLDGPMAPTGEVVWSVSPSDTGRSASTATSHGDFDDDAPTLNSMVLRVLDKQDADAFVPYEPLGARAREWLDEVDWPEAFQPPASDLAVPPPAPAPLAVSVSVAAPGAGGRRIALCIGIDAYPPQNRLSGCVHDARSWAGVLARLGFEVRTLLDAQATREALDSQLRQLVTQAQPGDVLVVQYSGHGTQVTDLGGDETDGVDEALCPVDFATGALFIDDDLAELLALLPDAVNLTFFMDCCHSGTNTRFAVGLGAAATVLPPDSKARFVEATPELLEAHRRFRVGRRAPLRRGGRGGPQHMRHVKFAACRDEQVALESAGQGDYTRRATRVLARGIAGLSNEAFLQAVLDEFGSGARQQPMLDCAPQARAAALLQPLARSVQVPADLLQR